MGYKSYKGAEIPSKDGGLRAGPLILMVLVFGVMFVSMCAGLAGDDLVEGIGDRRGVNPSGTPSLFNDLVAQAEARGTVRSLDTLADMEAQMAQYDEEARQLQLDIEVASEERQTLLNLRMAEITTQREELGLQMARQQVEIDRQYAQQNLLAEQAEREISAQRTRSAHDVALEQTRVSLVGTQGAQEVAMAQTQAAVVAVLTRSAADQAAQMAASRQMMIENRLWDWGITGTALLGVGLFVLFVGLLARNLVRQSVLFELPLASPTGVNRPHLPHRGDTPPASPTDIVPERILENSENSENSEVLPELDRYLSPYQIRQLPIGSTIHPWAVVAAAEMMMNGYNRSQIRSGLGLSGKKWNEFFTQVSVCLREIGRVGR